LLDLILSGEAMIRAFREARIRYVTALPDATTSNSVLWPISRDPNFHLVRVCKEDEAVSMCAAFAACGERAVVLMQYTGFLDSINAIRSVGVEYKQPVCMIIGLLEKEPGIPPARSRVYSVRIVEPILDALGVDHFCMEGNGDIAKLTGAIERAYETSRPLAALVGHYVDP
jgi:sulfopyruvate decarboxylase subunit alpha